MKNLLIVESPNKIGKLTKLLKKISDEKWIVTASVGHFCDLAIREGYGGLGIKDTNNYEGIYKNDPKKSNIITELKELANGADKVFLATDPDREGEAIAWHLQRLLNLEDNYVRASFNELSEKALKKAISTTAKIDIDLVNAQETRRILDRIVGFELSSSIRQIDPTLKSVGRVQTPAVRLIYDREKEIKNFVSKEYNQIFLTDEFDNKFNIDGIKWPEISKEDADEIEKNVTTNNLDMSTFSLESTEEQVANKKALTTNDALQMGVKQKWTTQKTSEMLQKLFSDGYVTYIRTDSHALDEEWVNLSRVALEYKDVDAWKNPRTSKNAQEAHEAVRPIDIKNNGDDISDEDTQKLYQLILDHTKKVIGEKAIDIKVTRKISTNKIDGKKIFSLTNSSSFVKVPGWRNSEVQPPNVELSKNFKVIKESKKTSPPTKFNEASFLKQMEKKGIGRPSTFASILNLLLLRNYIKVNAKGIVESLDIGNKLLNSLSGETNKITAIEYTSNLEKELDEITLGKKSKKEVLDKILASVEKAKNETKELLISQSVGECPDCSNPLIKKNGKYGEYIGCSNCQYIKRAEILGKTGDKCPECKKSDLVEKQGKKKFIACEDSECGYIKRPELKTTGEKCPQCKKSDLVERKGKKGKFVACSGFPKCKFIKGSKGKKTKKGW